MITIWVAAIIVFLILEAATVALTSTWFALGALAALISALFNAPIWLQITWFLVISVATLCLARPLVAKYINSKRQATNADRIIGTDGVVQEDINNIAATGLVSAGGKLWTARSFNGEIIEKGELVTAVRIEGVKLIVVPAAGSAAEYDREAVTLKEEY